MISLTTRTGRAEALRSSSDKAKEHEKELGKERRKSLAMIGKADQLDLEAEKLSKEKDEREKLLALKAEAEFKLREDIVQLNENSAAYEEEISELQAKVTALKEEGEFAACLSVSM